MGVEREGGWIGGSSPSLSQSRCGRVVVRVRAAVLFILPVDVVTPGDGGILVLLGGREGMVL